MFYSPTYQQQFLMEWGLLLISVHVQVRIYVAHGFPFVIRNVIPKLALLYFGKTVCVCTMQHNLSTARLFRYQPRWILGHQLCARAHGMAMHVFLQTREGSGSNDRRSKIYSKFMTW